jgi:hypothetical protein
MELFDNLASFGLTSSVLQIVIIGGALLLLVGFFWKYILAGLGVAFCVAVFAMPSKKIDKPSEVVVPAVVQPETKEPSKSLKPNEEIVEVKPEPDTSEKGMFMTDCQKYGGYTASQCVAFWNDRENDKVRYRSATNKMFMMKTKYHYNL